MLPINTHACIWIKETVWCGYLMPSVLLLLKRTYTFAEGLDYYEHRMIGGECSERGGTHLSLTA